MIGLRPMKMVETVDTVVQGAMTALVTPMHDKHDKAVDYDGLSKLIENQINAGIDGVVVVGTTGESATLTFQEKTQIVRHAVQVADGRIPIIAGAGANATEEAIALTKAAEKAGAAALLHVTPYYNKPSQQGLCQHFRQIAGATSLPIILYNVPSRTSCDLLPETVVALCDTPNIAAIKEATGCMHRASEIISKVGDRLVLLSGDDFTAYAAYCLGARGVISVVSNILPDRVAQMWAAVAQDNLARARELHYQLLPLTTLLFAEPNPIPAKAALALMSQIHSGIRSPLHTCSDDLRQRLQAQLTSEGVL